MSIVFIEGRNSGYPCIAKLMDFPSAALTLPFPEYLLKFEQGKNNDYPHISRIPKIPRQMALLPPYPDFLMYCLGEAFNDGYPCILKLENIERRMFSNVYFGNFKAEELFMGGRAVESAYCNGQRVYGMIYVTKSE